MKPFDYVTSVSYNKKNMMRDTENDELAESGYQPYLSNKALSYHVDSLFHSNEMNMNHHIDNKLQFDFLLNTLRTRKRYTPWLKAKKEKYLEYVKEYYGYSNEKAKSALNILNDEQIKTIMNSLDKGGKHGK